MGAHIVPRRMSEMSMHVKAIPSDCHPLQWSSRGAAEERQSSAAVEAALSKQHYKQPRKQRQPETETSHKTAHCQAGSAHQAGTVEQFLKYDTLNVSEAHGKKRSHFAIDFLN